MSSFELLLDGMKYAKAGKKDQARELLIQFVNINDISDGWLWLSEVVESNEERRYCLERILKSNPGSEIAHKGLSLLPKGTQSIAPAGVRQRSEIHHTIALPETYIVDVDDPAIPAKKGSAIGMLILLIVLSCVALSVIGSRTSTNTTADSSDDYGVCKESVTKQLKSPTSATFPKISDVTIVADTAMTWSVIDYVDAQNSFGATIRTYYACNATYNPSTKNIIGKAVLE